MYKILYGWDGLDTFLHSLEYWQIINLHATLLMANSNIDLVEAKRQAIANFDTDFSKLKPLLSQALNSPNPKM